MGCFWQNNQFLLKIKNLIIFQTFIFKWIKSVTIFYWLEANLCQNWKQKLKQAIFAYSACQPLTLPHERIQKFRETANFRHLYGNESDKVCLAHDVAHPDSKDLAKTTISDEILKNRA